MSHWDNVDPDFEKLILLLKKILKKQPQAAEQLSKLLGAKSVQLNLCFLTLMPMSPDEWNELNELYDDAMNRIEGGAKPEADFDLDFRITSNDLDFLKENGIEF